MPDRKSPFSQSHKPSHLHKIASGEAHAIVRPSRFSVLWIIPMVAISVSAWLAWNHFSHEGPLITISFDTADGIVPGQTQVRDRAVPLGTVEDVKLTKDLKHALVRVRMNSGAESYLTNYTRFWVVRAQINGAGITGLDTLLSGAYIALDPGLRKEGDKPAVPQTKFVGLEAQPGLRSDQPGSTFWLLTTHLGSLGAQSPVFYRDIPVGEVVGYTLPPEGDGPFTLQVFVHHPYDRYIRPGSRFWDVSGLQIGLGAGGLKVNMQSLQALISGGVAFGMPDDSEIAAADEGVKIPSATPNSLYWLYESQAAAEDTKFKHRLHLATYFQSPIGTLTQGSQVKLFGIQVGVVTSVALQMSKDNRPQVRVDMELEPGRIRSVGAKRLHLSHEDNEKFVMKLVQQGMEATIQTASMLTGESEISLNMGAPDANTKVTLEDNVIILPSKAGGLSGLMQSASVIADKISKMPLQKIGEHVNDLLKTSDDRLKSEDVTQSLHALRGSLVSLNKILDHADEHMPALLDNLNGTLANAQDFLHKYGTDSDFSRNLGSMVIQLTQAAHSLRLLVNYMDAHPNAVITGR